MPDHVSNGTGRDSRSPDRIAVRRNGRVVLVRLDEIDWIEACDNYVCLHCGRETHTLRATLTDLEVRLGQASFLRIHRSAIVNLDRIRELQPWFRGDYRVILRDGTELILKKSHREQFESRLLFGSVSA
jgi:two-component system LytT family response regulator